MKKQEILKRFRLFQPRKWVGFLILVVLSLLVGTVAFADDLQTLLAQLHIIESATPPSVSTYGVQRNRQSTGPLPLPPRVESLTPNPSSQPMSLREVQAAVPFTLHYPTYIPKGFQLAHVTILPLSTQRVAITFQEENSTSASLVQAHMEIVEYPSQLDEGNSPYSVPVGAGRVVQVGRVEAVYVDGVWSGNPPQRDDRFHQLIFQRDNLKFFLYAPRERIPLDELIQVAGSLRPYSP